MRRVLVLATALLAATPAGAHRGHSALSIVSIDPLTGTVVVTHRFAAHDLEPALVSVAPEAQHSLDDPAAMTALVAYVGRRFGVTGAQLVFRTQQLRGDNVVLVYVGKLPTPVTSVEVRADLFGEVHDDQETQVNVRLGKLTRTLLFRSGDGTKAVRFAGVSPTR